MSLKSTFTVSLDIPEAKDAVLEFKKPRANAYFKRALEKPGEKPESDEDKIRAALAGEVEARRDILTNQLVSVKGLKEDEKEITKEQLANLDIDLVTLNAIIIAYNLGAYPRKPESEKKSSSQESSSEQKS